MFDPDSLVLLSFLQDTAQHKLLTTAVAVRDISVMDPGSEPLSRSQSRVVLAPLIGHAVHSGCD